MACGFNEAWDCKEMVELGEEVGIGMRGVVTMRHGIWMRGAVRGGNRGLG